MLFMNLAILGLSFYEGYEFVRKGFGRELIVYIALMVVAIALEFYCISFSNHTSLATIIINLLKLSPNS